MRSSLKTITTFLVFLFLGAGLAQSQVQLTPSALPWSADRFNGVLAQQTLTTTEQGYPSTGELHFDVAGFRQETTLAPTGALSTVFPGGDSRMSGQFYLKVPESNEQQIGAANGIEAGVENFGPGNLANVTGVFGYAYNYNDMSMSAFLNGGWFESYANGADVQTLNGLIVSTYIDAGGSVTQPYGIKGIDVWVDTTGADEVPVSYGINIDGQASEADVNWGIYVAQPWPSFFAGAVMLGDPGDIPTCDVSRRGQIWFDADNVLDRLFFCAATDGMTYEWREFTFIEVMP